MSGFIAVSVTLIGLTGVLFTLAIFIQMILSFPAMLSSNSQAYVHQQRKTYNISADQDATFLETTAEVDAEWEDEQQEQETAHTSVEIWIDSLDEATHSWDSDAEVPPRMSERGYPGARQAEPITRGRSLRRRRAIVSRRDLRPKNSQVLNDQREHDFEVEQSIGAENVSVSDRQKCSPGWRKSMRWTR
ncbi:unnamed protein product [Discula destructiva]